MRSWGFYSAASRGMSMQAPHCRHHAAPQAAGAGGLRAAQAKPRGQPALPTHLCHVHQQAAQQHHQGAAQSPGGNHARHPLSQLDAPAPVRRRLACRQRPGSPASVPVMQWFGLRSPADWARQRCSPSANNQTRQTRVAQQAAGGSSSKPHRSCRTAASHRTSARGQGRMHLPPPAPERCCRRSAAQSAPQTSGPRTAPPGAGQW